MTPTDVTGRLSLPGGRGGWVARLAVRRDRLGFGGRDDHGRQAEAQKDGCAAAVAIWPDGVLAFFNSFAHGLDLSPVKSTQPFSLFRFLCGLAGLALVGFVSGAIFACTYNLVTRE